MEPGAPGFHRPSDGRRYLQSKMRWQKRYYRGLTMQDQPGISDHQAKLRLPEFTDNRTRTPASPAARVAALPEFHRKVAAVADQAWRAGAAHARLLARGQHAADLAGRRRMRQRIRQLSLGLRGTQPVATGLRRSARCRASISRSTRRRLAVRPLHPRRRSPLSLPRRGRCRQAGRSDARRRRERSCSTRPRPTSCSRMGNDRARPGAPAVSRRKLPPSSQRTEALCRHPALDELLMPARKCRAAAGGAQRHPRSARGRPERLRAIPESLRMVARQWLARGFGGACHASARNWERLRPRATSPPRWSNRISRRRSRSRHAGTDRSHSRQACRDRQTSGR